MSELGPITTRERLATLDVLRGFALCGVMMGNLNFFSGLWVASDDHPAVLDRIAHGFLSIVVESKAQTLLTMLFGFGFAVQLLRAEQRNEPVMALYVRRLLALLVFGALHILLLWWGDVTWGYAISGFGLLAFVRRSNRTLIVAAAVLLFVPVLLWSIEPIREATIRVFLGPDEFWRATDHLGEVMHRPDHSGLWWEHLRFALLWHAVNYGWCFLWTLGRFLLGYLAGRMRWFERDGAEHLLVFRRLALWGGAIAVATAVVNVLGRTKVLSFDEGSVSGQFGSQAVSQIGYLSTAFAYVGVVVLLMQRPLWRRILGIVAPVGRMPLTTYLSQSLICTFLFYGWGLGWAGSVGAAGTIGVAVVIFSVQVAICHLWLRYFRFGPLEWLWRAAVYLKLPQMRVL